MRYFGIRELVPCVDGHCKDGRCGVDESTIVRVPGEVIENAIALVEQVLDPARKALGKPIKVNSGYRCPLKNKAVGGVAGSQHLRGEAADICCQDNKRLAEIIEANGRYDQLIRYMNGDGSIRFIHVSWKRTGVNRKQKLIKK